MYSHLKQYLEKVISAFKRLKKRGFTLIELMVVITIIAILSSVGISVYSGALKRTNQTRIRAELEGISKTYEIGFVPDQPNMQGNFGKYTPLQSSDFAGGKIPAPPKSTSPEDSYVVTGPDDKAIQNTDIGYLICADLDTLKRCSDVQTNPNCLCKSSQKGETNLANLIPPPPPPPVGGGLTIANITDNQASYTNSEIPMYEKFEITFDVLNSVATNYFYPYDNSLIPGLDGTIGITVNAQFSKDSTFQTGVYTIPAFYYHYFDYQIKTPGSHASTEWIYPKNVYQWKARFAPNQTGIWYYLLTAQDATGSTISHTSQPFPQFMVVNNTNTANNTYRGFIRVSSNDFRYFEYDDGKYFPALGYNMNYDDIKWDGPQLNNRPNFQVMKTNGIQLARHWISQWGIFSSNNVTWASTAVGPPPGADVNGIKVPFYVDPSNGQHILLPASPRTGADVAMMLQRFYNPCMVLGAHKEGPAIKPNTIYKVFIRYLIPVSLPPAATPGLHGLTAKIWDWLDSPQCAQAGQGAVVAGPVSQVSTKDGGGNWQWQILEGTIDTANTANLPPQNLGNNFIRRFYLTMDNVDHSSALPSAPRIFIDRVEIREQPTGSICTAAAGSGLPFDLSNGQCGVNIISRPYMDEHQYIDQKYSYAFDKMLEEAKANDVYLKLVILEKNEYIQNHIDFNGQTMKDNQSGCNPDLTKTAEGSGCPGNYAFYGNGRNMTKIRWLQRAWWKYLQARWGYSTNIHSWELLNEGSPASLNHRLLADEMGQYMHCEVFGVPVTDGQKCNFDHPNDHLVTTSNWTDYPLNGFWKNALYPNLDYADVHQYIFRDLTDPLDIDGTLRSLYTANVEHFDSTSAVEKLSKLIGAKYSTYGSGVNKPVMRGETGLTLTNSDTPNDAQIAQDANRIWLQKFIWSQINSSGVIDNSYWYEKAHIYPGGYRSKFGNYYNFIKDIPLNNPPNNGVYIDAAATSPNTDVRIIGQKETTNDKAHLWIDNKTHTWGNVVNNQAIATINQGTTVTFGGMDANTTYNIYWFDSYSNSTTPEFTGTVVSDGSGNITLSLPDSLPRSTDSTKGDIAVKVERQ